MMRMNLFFKSLIDSGINPHDFGLQQNENYRFRLQAAAMDHGPHPEGSQDRSQVNVVITVASSKIKPPSFINPPMAPVSLQENYT